MKSVIAATLVLFTVSTSALAFEMPSMDGMPDGVQQMMQGKGGKRGQQRAAQGEEAQQGQQGQQSGRGGMKGLMNSAMKGDISGLQGSLSSFGQ